MLFYLKDGYFQYELFLFSVQEAIHCCTLAVERRRSMSSLLIPLHYGELQSLTSSLITMKLNLSNSIE